MYLQSLIDQHYNQAKINFENRTWCAMTFSMKPFLVSFTSVSWPNSIFYSFQITTELLWIQHSRYPCSCLPRFWLQTWVPLACQLLSRQHRAGRGWKRQSGAKLQRVSKFDLKSKLKIQYAVELLTLWLVDGECKSRFDRKLSPTPCMVHPQITKLWDEHDSWN